MPQTLEEYHAKIERMMAEGDAWLVARDAASEELIKRRIAESALVLASYQLFVHREVFAPMLQHADTRTRARVNELKVECIALTEDLRLNVRELMARAADAPLDWDGVVAGVAWFNGRVRAHIAQVRQMMAPDLSDDDHARLRAHRNDIVGTLAA
jgi:hypothetical protein